MKIEPGIRKFLDGARNSELSELSLSARQLSMISEQMACLQEKIADQPIAVIAKETIGVMQNVQGDDALEEHSGCMVRMLDDADKQRINTLKELINIISPVQAVDFLVAGKKLNLCIHKWGKKRDSKHG